MENASKTLIIAGAILISILIISLGVLVYNQAQGTVSRANLNSQEAQTQNGQFESYFGTDVTANDVRQLLSLVRTNNLTATRSGESKVIGVALYVKQGTAAANGLTPATGTGDVNSNGVYVQANKPDPNAFWYTADVQAITNSLKTGTSFTVNVPNSKAYRKDSEGLTGFEEVSGAAHSTTNDYLAVLANDTNNGGGYYSSGFIRLIYIMDNSFNAP
jgi:hypothetical protein